MIILSTEELADIIPYELAINDILQKLSLYHVSYFTLDRSHHNGLFIRLSNRVDWLKTYFANKLFENSLFEDDPRLYQSGYISWQDFVHNPVYQAAYDHNIANGITAIYQYGKYCDFANFGVNPQHTGFIEDYLANKELFDKFYYYFIEKFSPVIRKLYDRQIKIGQTTQVQKTMAVNLPLMEKYVVYYQGKKIELTQKEFKIIQEMKHGHTADLIGKKVFSSKRTIEANIIKIKEKFNCTSLLQLGYILGKIDVSGV